MTSLSAPAILYVEDDPDDRLLAEMAHRDSGVINPLVFVGDGEEALEYLRGTGRHADRVGKAQPGIILLDLNLPAHDGRDTLGIVKADPALRRIPVVILTTSSAERDIATSYGAGANSYIVKPAAFTSLVDLFERLSGYWFEMGSLAREVTP
ncbi:MAG: response regulator [Candidatus Limnocylindrales bacterium]|jgi:two-component system response regulator